MPDGAKTILVILLIPFLLGLGHDIYFNYFSNDEKVQEIKALRFNPDKFLISDAGWVFNEYAPNFMQSLRDSAEPQTWRKRIDPILQLPTMIVGLIPWAIAVMYLLIAYILGIWPCKGRLINLLPQRKRKDDFAVYKHAKTKSAKYKRK